MLFRRLEKWLRKVIIWSNLKNFFMRYLRLITPLLILMSTANFVQANEISLEEEIKEAFENYPFKCNPEGSTPEMAACIWIDLIKSDRALRRELDDLDTFKGWVKFRDKVCNHFQNKPILPAGLQ